MDLIMTGISTSERIRRVNLVTATRNLIMDKLQIGGPSTRLAEVRNLVYNFISYLCFSYELTNVVMYNSCSRSLGNKAQWKFTLVL